LKKNLFYPRVRKETPDPRISLRLQRSEYGADFRLKKIDLDSFYPDTTKLLKSLSKFHGVREDSILVGLGAESLIKDIFIWFSRKYKSKKILNIIPNYFMYTFFSKVFDIKEYNLFYNPSGKNISSKLIIETLKKDNIKLLILVNPSSPFERNWSIKEIITILNFSKRNNIIVLLDEVYQLMGSKSASALLKKFSNLLILRSFSKGFGFPGIRSGYILTNKNLIKEIETYRLAIELPSDTIEKSIYLLNNFKKIVKKRIQFIIEARKFAHQQLKKRGFKSFNHFSNSVSFKFSNEKEKNKICEGLQKSNILINYKYQKPLNCYANITTTNKNNIVLFLKKLDLLTKKNG
jgi:histidinol-phosphate aminotransferase